MQVFGLMTMAAVGALITNAWLYFCFGTAGLIIGVIPLIFCLLVLMFKSQLPRKYGKKLLIIVGVLLGVLTELLIFIIIPWCCLYFWSRLYMVEKTFSYDMHTLDLIDINATSCGFDLILDPAMEKGSLGIDVLYKGRFNEKYDKANKLLKLQIFNSLAPLESCQFKFIVNPLHLPMHTDQKKQFNYSLPGIKMACSGKCNLIGKTGERILDLGNNQLSIRGGNKAEATMNVNIGALSTKAIDIQIHYGNIQLSWLKIKEESAITTGKGTIIVQGEGYTLELDKDETYCLGGDSITQNGTSFSMLSAAPQSNKTPPRLILKSTNGEVKVNSIKSRNESPKRIKSSYSVSEDAIKFSHEALELLEGIMEEFNTKENEENNIILETRSVHSESSKHLKWVIAKTPAYIQTNPWFIALAMMSKAQSKPYRVIANLMNTECPYKPFFTQEEIRDISALINTTFKGAVDIALIQEDQKHFFYDYDGFLHRTESESEKWYSVDREGKLVERRAWENPSVLFAFVISAVFPVCVVYILMKLGAGMLEVEIVKVQKIKKLIAHAKQIKGVFLARKHGVYTTSPKERLLQAGIGTIGEGAQIEMVDINQLMVPEVEEEEELETPEEKQTQFTQLLGITHPIKIIDYFLHFVFNPSFVNPKTEFKDACLHYSKTQDKEYYLAAVNKHYDEFAYLTNRNNVSLPISQYKCWGFRITKQTVREYKNIIVMYNVKTGGPTSTMEDFLDQCCKLNSGFEEDSVLEYKFMEQFAIFKKCDLDEIPPFSEEMRGVLESRGVKIINKKVRVLKPAPGSRKPQFDFNNIDKDHFSYANILILIGSCLLWLIAENEYIQSFIPALPNLSYLISIYVCLVLMGYWFLYGGHTVWHFFRNLIIYALHILFLLLLAFPVIFYLYTMEVTYEYYTLQTYSTLLSWIDFKYFPWRIMYKLPEIMGFYFYIIPLMLLVVFVLYYFVTITHSWIRCNYPRKTHHAFSSYRPYLQLLMAIGIARPKKCMRYLHICKWIFVALSVGLWGFYAILWVEWLVIGALISQDAYLEYATYAITILCFAYLKFATFSDIRSKAINSACDSCSNGLKEMLWKAIKLYGGDVAGIQIALNQVHTGKKKQRESNILLTNLYSLVDTDNSGKISIDEFAVLLRRLGIPKNTQKLIEIFTEVKGRVYVQEKEAQRQKAKKLKYYYKMEQNEEKLELLKKVKKIKPVSEDGLNKKEFKYALHYIRIMDEENQLEEAGSDIPALAMKMIQIMMGLAVIFLFFEYAIEAFTITGGLTAIMPIGGALLMSIWGE